MSVEVDGHFVGTLPCLLSTRLSAMSAQGNSLLAVAHGRRAGRSHHHVAVGVFACEAPARRSDRDVLGLHRGTS